MGYYNDVGLVLTKEQNVQLKGGILLETNAGMIDKFLNTARHYKHSNDELYVWNSIKWYDYPGVKYIENFIQKLIINDKQKEYFFVRVGEDLDDIEESGEYFDNSFDLHINIEVNFTK